ncbi:hypothetical protein WEI85_23795 [Actinomycetes bacterium KLBMP 9797]
MGPEPPPEYIAFVSRHLSALRRESARVVGDERDADLLYPDVLADVAGRWRWLELLRTRLGETGAADLYLARAFTRRSERWQPAHLEPVDVWVGPTTVEPVVAAYRPPRWSSVALRLAAQVDSTRRPEARPMAEAAVAWWHAYEHRRHRRLVAAAVAALVFVALLVRAPQELDALPRHDQGVPQVVRTT